MQAAVAACRASLRVMTAALSHSRGSTAARRRHARCLAGKGTWKRSRSEGTFGLWHVLSSTQAPRELSTLLQSPTFAVYTCVPVRTCTIRVVPPVGSRPSLWRANTASSSRLMVARCARGHRRQLSGEHGVSGGLQQP